MGWKQRLVFLVAFCTHVGPLYAQEKAGSITGTVVDAGSNRRIEYANVLLLNSADSSLVTGSITSPDGSLLLSDLKPGRYLLEIRFLGFQSDRREVVVTESETNLGEIRIHPSDVVLDAVVVEGERSPVSYELDKKVLNVDRLPLAASGTAVDALEHIPSVTVDIAGNVSLRGSQSFTVLIDGRPTVLEPQDALQQLPASSIETIEVITNPSAKYDPEGAAGIINVVLKKDHAAGLSGIANASAGLEGQYGGDLLLDFRDGPVGLTFGVDYNTRILPGNTTEQRVTFADDTTLYYDASGTGENGRTTSGIRGGIELRLSDNDVTSFSARYGERAHEGNSIIQYSEWSDIEPVPQYYTNRNSNERAGNHYSVSASHVHTFSEDMNQLTADATYSFRDSEDFDLTELYQDETLQSGLRSTEFGPSRELRGRVDYTLPLGASARFESGYEGEFDEEEEGNGLYVLDSTSYVLQPEYSHDTENFKSEHALYATFQDYWGGLGILAGLRGEYTYRSIAILDTGEEFIVDRVDYFPTAHLSYKFAAETQLMASYSRRIERPRGWYLEPFYTWTDANNIRLGNPALQPEFFDSYELGFQTLFGEVSMTSELYYRINTNKIERLRSAYDDNVTLTTFENIGQDYSLGAEMLINFDILSFWNVNLMGNIYHYRVKGVLFGDPFSREDISWRGRFNNILELSSTTQLQVNAGYQSSTVYAQGSREGSFTTDLAVRQDVFSKTISLTMMVRDVFDTQREEVYYEGLDQYSYTTATRIAPLVEFSIRLNFNNYRSQDGRERPEPEGPGGFDE